MNNDQAARSARRLATAVALPLAVVAGFIAFQTLKPAPAPTASPSPSPRVMTTAPVEIAAVKLDERQALVCRAFLSKLPERVRELDRRQVTGGHEQNAAFGDPALTLACGGSPLSFDPADVVYPINGVCWHANKAGTVWTTVDREVPITLTLPAELAGAGSGQWAGAFSPTVTASVLSSPTKPSGCR